MRQGMKTHEVNQHPHWFILKKQFEWGLKCDAEAHLHSTMGETIDALC